MVLASLPIDTGYLSPSHIYYCYITYSNSSYIRVEDFVTYPVECVGNHPNLIRQSHVLVAMQSIPRQLARPGEPAA